MMVDPAFKAIFKYIFPIKRFLSLLTIYNAEYIHGLLGRENFLEETQKMIINTSSIIENTANEDWWRTPPPAGDGTFDLINKSGDSLPKEEQLDIPKKLLPVFTVLKVIEGLIAIVPPLKPWFKGLFEGIPKIINAIFSVIPSIPGLGYFKELVSSAGDTKQPKLPPMPGVKGARPRDILDEEEVVSSEEEC